MTSYIDTGRTLPRYSYGATAEDCHSWRTYTEDRLTWAHGYERARQIVSGLDPETNADVAAWKRLCARADR